MMLGTVDLVLLAVVLLSILVGFWRGFIKEVFALAVWAFALVVAFQFSGVLAELLVGHIEMPSARTGLAFTAIFVMVLVIGGLLTWLIGKLVKHTGLSGTDRLFGGVFGAVRGLVLLLGLVIAAGFTPIPADPWWQSSRVIQGLLPLAEWGGGFLPEPAAEYFDLYPEAAESAPGSEGLPEAEEAPEVVTS